MITTVTMNPCIDKTVKINEFEYGGLNRIQDSKIDPAGKGINVAVAFQQLHNTVACIGINYKSQGQLIADFLDNKKIDHDFVWAEGSLRTNLKINDLKNNITTEINENGKKITENHINELISKMRSLASQSDIIVFSGSVPQGVPSSVYKSLISEVCDFSVKTILDTGRELLLKGIEAKPYLIKPNLAEMEEAFNTEISDYSQIAELAADIIDRGVNIVCVSLGSEGAVIVNHKKAFYAPALSVPAKGVIGAGDAMVAGMCLGIEKNSPLKKILRFGIAAASASVIREGTQLCQKEDFDKLQEKVVIKEI